MFIFVRFLPEGHSLFMRNFNLISWAKPDQKNNYVSYGNFFLFWFFAHLHYLYVVSRHEGTPSRQ